MTRRARPTTCPLAFLLLLGAVPAVHAEAAPSAGVSLRGHVSSADGHDLAGATVTLAEAGRMVETSEQGEFRIDNLPPGRYTVVVRRVGYAPSVTQITLNASDEWNPVLTATELRLPDVEVTASRRPLATFETPLPLSSPGTETLRRAPRPRTCRAPIESSG